jgi:NitT/TauT family transport system substrate-binding protein
MQALESNVAQYAFSDVPALVLARARGASTAKMVAVNYQKAPYAVYSLKPGADIIKLEQLKGLEIGSGAGSFTPKVIQGFMKEKGLDPSTLKFTNVDGAARVPMLLSGKIPAIENFILSQPGIKRAVQSGELKTLLLADFGLELYANGILVRDSLLKSDPEQVRAFVQASLRGWKDALANPEAAADIELQYVKGLNRDVIIDELKIVRDLAVTPDTTAKGLGWIDAGKMKKSLDFVVQNIGVEGTPPLVADLYSTDYLPRTPVAP